MGTFAVFHIFEIDKIIFMVAIRGTYQKGYVKLEEEFLSDDPVKVIVTFLEEKENVVEKRLMLSDFHFAESQELLKNIKGSLGDSIIEERRSEL